jgi:hypothetical protein
MNRRLSGLFVTACAVALMASTVTFGQTKKVTVRFKQGSTGATYRNSVTGYGTVDFVLKANAGQTMSVKLTSSNTALYFNVRKEGADEALSDSARDATDWSGQLTEAGQYVIRVYLYRNEARRTRKAVPFRLRIDVN